MPTLATGKSKSAARGFTLVEVLVCIAILGLLSAAVVMTLPDSQLARSEAQRFVARVTLAAQDSIIDGAPRGMAVDARGYRFFRYRHGQWTPIEGREELAPAQWTEDVKVSGHMAAPADDTAAIKPGVVFNPTGLVTPFSIDFADAAGRHTVVGGATGEVALVSHEK
jgi:general secretion pathway protein H